MRSRARGSGDPGPGPESGAWFTRGLGHSQRGAGGRPARPLQSPAVPPFYWKCTCLAAIQFPSYAFAG